MSDSQELAALRERLRDYIVVLGEGQSEGMIHASVLQCIAEELERVVLMAPDPRNTGNAPQDPASAPEGPRRDALEALASHTAGCRCFYCAAMQKLLVMMDHQEEPKP